jgi:hypothetical protein
MHLELYASCKRTVRAFEGLQPQTVAPLRCSTAFNNGLILVSLQLTSQPHAFQATAMFKVPAITTLSCDAVLFSGVCPCLEFLRELRSCFRGGNGYDGNCCKIGAKARSQQITGRKLTLKLKTFQSTAGRCSEKIRPFPICLNLPKMGARILL